MRFHRTIQTVAIAACVIEAQEAQGPLPEAPGKDIVVKACAACHEMETVTGSRRTKLGWQQTVDDMISRGAEGSGEDMQAVVAYLTKYFGKVNVNTAVVQDLEKVLELSEKEAQPIVSYRERHTTIKDFEELKKVPGVSAEKLEAKRGLIAFSL